MQRMFPRFCLDCVRLLRSERGRPSPQSRGAGKPATNRESEASSVFAENRAPLRNLRLDSTMSSASELDDEFAN